MFDMVTARVAAIACGHKDAIDRSAGASIDRHIAMIMERSQTNVRERPRPQAATDQLVQQLQQRLSEQDDPYEFHRPGG